MTEREQALEIIGAYVRELAAPPSYVGSAPDLRVLALREAMRRIKAALVSPECKSKEAETGR